MANYINIDTLRYPVHEGDIRLEYPNTSFPRPFEPPENYAPVQAVPRPVVDHTQNVAEGAPEQINGVWTQKWEVTDATAAEVINRTGNKANQVRSERNKKLTESDWTQLADSPVADRAAWAAYRQALRDLTAQAGFPWAVVWPVSP